MPTELLVVVALVGLVTVVAVVATSGRSRPGHEWRSHLVTLGLVALIFGGGQALEQAHLSRRAHALWLLGSLLLLLLGFALFAQTRTPPRTGLRTTLVAGATVVAALFAVRAVTGNDPTDWLYGR